ncbi:protein of unknown function [Aminobacter niigataensis]|nr:protein of unknown function [Aminobacter niigataensis]
MRGTNNDHLDAAFDHPDPDPARRSARMAPFPRLGLRPFRHRRRVARRASGADADGPHLTALAGGLAAIEAAQAQSCAR